MIKKQTKWNKNSRAHHLGEMILISSACNQQLYEALEIEVSEMEITAAQKFY